MNYGQFRTFYKPGTHHEYVSRTLRRWNSKKNSCDGSSCRKRRLCAYCAGNHTIMSCPKSPMTNYWHSVNEKCPTRLPATQSHCVSCGTPRPGSAYSSHTDGPKEDEVRVDLRPRITSKMVNTILLSRPKGSTNPQRKASVPAHQ